MVYDVNESFIVHYLSQSRQNCGKITTIITKATEVTYTFEQTYFVESRLSVMCGTFYHLKGHEFLITEKEEKCRVLQ